MTRVIIDQPYAAMLADVVEGLHSAVTVAGEQDALTTQVKHHIVARVGHV